MSEPKHRFGPKGHIVDAFITHLEGMSDWSAVKDLVNTKWDDEWCAAWRAAINAAKEAEGFTALYEAGKAASYTALYEAREAAGLDEWDDEWFDADEAKCHAAADAAECAALEIQGADLLRERGQPFFFLPMFGFADERAVMAKCEGGEG